MGKQYLTGTICCRQQPCFTSMENKCPILVMLSEHTCWREVGPAAHGGGCAAVGERAPFWTALSRTAFQEERKRGRSSFTQQVAWWPCPGPPEIPQNIPLEFPSPSWLPPDCGVSVLQGHSGLGNDIGVPDSQRPYRTSQSSPLAGVHIVSAITCVV